MSRPPSTADAALSVPAGAGDPELGALPSPRRPGRTATLIAMALTGTLALLLAFSLRSECAYALSSGAPHDLGSLHRQPLRPEWANQWVRAEGGLSATGAIRYGRVLESDGFRLAPLQGSPRIWVEVRVPKALEGPHFVPPTSFVGRLVPFTSAGLRYSGLPQELRRAVGAEVPEDAWLLVDGEGPADARWVLGVAALLLAFAGFNAVGLVRLLRPVSDD